MSNLRTLRKQKGVNQTVVANYIGVSFQTYSRYEKGIIPPDQEKLKKLAEYFNVTVDNIQSQFPIIIEENDRRRYEESLMKKFARQFVKNNTLNHFISVSLYKRIPINFDFDNPDSSLVNERQYKVDVPFYYQESGKQVFCFLNKINCSKESLKPNDIIIARREYRVKAGDLVVVNLNQNDAIIMKVKVLNQKHYLYFLEGKNNPIEFVPNQNLKYIGLVLETRRIHVPLNYLGYLEEYPILKWTYLIIFNKPIL